MKAKLIMDTTSNNREYKVAMKLRREGNGIRCVFCEYHKGCNAEGYYTYNIRNWKKYRSTQWKEDSDPRRNRGRPAKPA